MTVYVPAWSKNTESDAVGTAAPLEPPEEADQFVVDDVFQVPVPPTQYLFAINYSCRIEVSMADSIDSVGAAWMIANQFV